MLSLKKITALSKKIKLPLKVFQENDSVITPLMDYIKTQESE